MQQRTALCEVSGLLKQILDVLGGRDGTEWARVFKRVLRRENPWEDSKDPILLTWRTVDVDPDFFDGPAADATRVMQSLAAKHVVIGTGAGICCDRPGRDALHARYDLVVVTPRQLGLSADPMVREVLDRAHRLRLDVCPFEVAAMIALGGADEGGAYRLVNLIRVSAGDERVWCVRISLSPDAPARLEMHDHPVRPSNRLANDAPLVFIKKR